MLTAWKSKIAQEKNYNPRSWLPQPLVRQLVHMSHWGLGGAK